MMLTAADIQYILQNEGADVTRLLLGKAPEGVNLPLCAKCIQAREKMKVKAPLWHSRPSLAYPFAVSVEQGSSQATALFKQQIIAELFQEGAPSLPSRNTPDFLRHSENSPLPGRNTHDFLRHSENSPLPGRNTPDFLRHSGDAAPTDGIITADLTGGMGIDSYFISRISSTHYYFERNEELCTATEYNFRELGADNIIASARDITADGCAALKELEGKGISLLYIDPARRTQSGGKAILLQDYEPNIIELQERMFAVSRHILVKVSPMADIKLNLKHLPKTSAIYVVAVENECKELLFLLDREHDGSEPPVYCCNVVLLYNQLNNSELKNRSNAISEKAKTHVADYLQVIQKDVVKISEEEQATATYATALGKYLYEPNKAILKGGAYKLVSQRYGCRKLAVSTHLYTADEEIAGFPGKRFIVEEVLEFNKKALKDVAARYPKADLTARNFPLDTNALKKQSGIKDGGTRHIFAVTLSNGKKMLVVTVPADHETSAK